MPQAPMHVDEMQYHPLNIHMVVNVHFMFIGNNHHTLSYCNIYCCSCPISKFIFAVTSVNNMV